MVLQNYNRLATSHKNLKFTPKGAHCILMLLTLQICFAFIRHSPSSSFEAFFKLKKKNALITITPTLPNLNLSP
jgi:hypothetical protein